ncbi:hypothetical protein ERJ75_000748500 [Trypanosoma vivax]|uniref:Nudix hydrolase domain-containing protein n=1 Tax=Trypanosoma vivax (strain Y486) TaxID=1055687 RepID=G0U090_TRYVY|nr:hypothetical protein TRVL_00559 [Trypanosoma vivax]KAH8613695.1 hypothetical protein ERJ75_000748500 [Trypanosoma vivax]CCC49488.1 conserved hypothetical protein [Trypanosoma vivax Y486]
MALPATDVKLLSNAVQRLAERALFTYVPGGSRRNVALILRFGTEEQQRTVRQLLAGHRPEHTAVQCISRLQLATDATLAPSLKLLFVKRADLRNDRWSGSVTFPGGWREKADADDLAALCSRVNEMLGIPLESPEFLLLGRLRDYFIRSRMRCSAGSVQSRFVFLHIGELTPTLHCAPHMVERVQWVPLSTFSSANITWTSVSHPFEGFVYPKSADEKQLLSNVFPRANFIFPSLQLQEQWHVWGLALRSTNELMSLNNAPPIDWPLVSSDHPLLQYFVIDPSHGYFELYYVYLRVVAWWSRGKSPTVSCGTKAAQLCERHRAIPPDANPLLWAVPDRVKPRHLFFLFIDLVIGVLLVYFVASVVEAVRKLIRLVMDTRTAAHQKKKKPD